VTEKRILVVDADLLTKIDESRGELGRSEFLNILYKSQFDADIPDTAKPVEYVSHTEFQEFTEGIKELMRNFLEFALSYGVEMGKQPANDGTFAEISRKLKFMGQKLS
jgi:hypothetical protein